MVIKRLRGTLSVLLVVTAVGFGNKIELSLSPSGFGSFELGQIMDADSLTIFTGGNYQVNHLLFQRFYAGLNLKVDYEGLPVTTNLEVVLKSFSETPRKNKVFDDNGLGVRFFYFFFLSRMDFVYSLGDVFNLGVGYFPVKYNRDAYNLGEYLFRSGTYPQYLTTNFDYPLARVTGLNAFGILPFGLGYQALLTINTEGATMGDLNFSLLASGSLFDSLIDLGGGISFCNFFSANSRHTRPPVEDVQGNLAALYIDDDGDTATYTFAGTKLMARVAFDPKVLFSSDIFGKEDLRLFAEVAILGVKNYPVSIDTSTLGTCYDNVLERMPVMFGINIPTFKLLDVLSVQAQWFGSRYPNDATNYVLYGLPTPVSSKWSDGSNCIYPDSTEDDWKWSVYAKKTLFDHFSVVGQIASDHQRWDKFSYGDQVYMLNEALTRPDQYYYVVKLGFSF
ncbi:MAG: hypothetical protein JW863_17955 [Chitinispirillaceae bacterium]|nr:hypothetical protein [Chitinispirillaceae bacterium]